MNVSVIVSLIDRYSAEASKFKRTLQGMRTGVRDFGHGLEEVVTSGLAARFDERAFGDHLNRLEARASHARSRLTGALGMALSLAAPVKLAADFDQSFKGLEKVVGAPLKRLQELRKFALDTSAIVPVAAKDIIELMAEAAQGGVPVNELEAFSLYVANAAVAFDMAGAQIGERFARLRNVYRLNREGLKTLGDATNHLSNNMAAKAAEITNFANRAAGAAKIFNLTAIETGSVGAAMIAAGIIPETAARGFNAMATRVEANAKGVEDAFEALGTSREQFLGDLDTDGAAEIRNLFAAMAESKKGMEALIALVGQDFADDFAKFLGNPELLKQALELTGDAAAYAGSAVEEARKQASGATRQFDLLKNRLTRTAILIGTVLLPPLLKLAETVGGVTDQFAAWAQANPELASVLVQSADAMLAFGIASRVAGFLWAASGLRLFRFLGLFMRLGRAGRNVALLAGPLQDACRRRPDIRSSGPFCRLVSGIDRTRADQGRTGGIAHACDLRQGNGSDDAVYRFAHRCRCGLVGDRSCRMAGRSHRRPDRSGCLPALEIPGAFQSVHEGFWRRLLRCFCTRYRRDFRQVGKPCLGCSWLGGRDRRDNRNRRRGGDGRIRPLVRLLRR